MVSLLRLIKKQDGKCYYCQRDIHRVPASVTRVPAVAATKEHRKPRSKGGTDCKSNVVAACHECNNRKGDMPEHIFISVELPKILAERALKKELKRARRVERKSERKLAENCNGKDRLRNTRYEPGLGATYSLGEVLGPLVAVAGPGVQGDENPEGS